MSSSSKSHNSEEKHKCSHCGHQKREDIAGRLNESPIEIDNFEFNEKEGTIDEENETIIDEERGDPEKRSSSQLSGVIDHGLQRGIGGILSKVSTRREGTGVPISKASTKVSVNNTSKIPNGGFQAWLQVMGSFFLFFNTWGIVNTYGVYQTTYEISILKANGPSQIAWIGSVQAFLLMLVGGLTGPVYDAGYFRELLIVGSFLVVFGHMMLSLCTEFYQVLLAQAFCIGIGTGCLFVPGVAIISTYFHSKLALATGLAASGSSLGGVIYPIVLNRLIPRIGFGWSVRVIGFMALATLLVSNLVMKPRVLPAAQRPLIDWTAFKSLPFMLFVIGSFIGFMGLFIFFFYVQLYVIKRHITDENLAFYLLSVINAASVFGRIIPNFVADKVGPLNIIVPCALISGLLTFCLIPLTSKAGLIIITLLFGFFSGSLVSLPPTIVVHMSPNRGLIGTRLGMCFGIVAVGVLIGTPIAGAILDSRGFESVWIFGGTLTVVGGALMAISRVAFKGAGLLVKA